MAYENFKPAVWSELIDRALEKNLVFGKLANRKYEGDIARHGSTVTIPRIGSATIGDYTGADITFGEDAGAKQIIAIDKSKYFALTFDDVDMAQSLGAIKDTVVEEAIYKMADTVDMEMAKLEAKVVATNRVAVANGGSILAGGVFFGGVSPVLNISGYLVLKPSSCSPNPSSLPSLNSIFVASICVINSSLFFTFDILAAINAFL